MTGVKSRISQLPSILGVSKSYFFSKIEVAPSGFRGSGLNGEVYSDVLVRIMTEYPSVNIEWVLLAKGEPIKEIKQAQSISIGSENQDNFILGEGKISTEQADIRVLDNFFISQIEEKDRQIRALYMSLEKAQATIYALAEIRDKSN